MSLVVGFNTSFFTPTYSSKSSLIPKPYGLFFWQQSVWNLIVLFICNTMRLLLRLSRSWCCYLYGNHKINKCKTIDQGFYTFSTFSTHKYCLFGIFGSQVLLTKKFTSCKSFIYAVNTSSGGVCTRSERFHHLHPALF